MDINRDWMDILNRISGLLLVDSDEKVVFMCKDLIQLCGYSQLDEVKDKNIRDLLAHNNSRAVLKSGKPALEFYLTEGQVVVSKGLPLYKDGKVIGALEFDLFQSSEEIEKFLKILQSPDSVEHFIKGESKSKSTKYSISDLKGSSSDMQNLKKEIKLAARSNSNVMIVGETGTGKELVAHSIHQLSQRNLFEFVSINCGAVPGELFESELFGYEEGAFTGAKRGGKKGLAEIADKGTLLLDEIDALPLPMQAKLLRFIQEKEIQRIGGRELINLDIRVISATNKNLLELVEKGEFRADLYYRLHVIEIEVSPLRKRKSDIPELVNNFLESLNNSLGRSVDKHRVKNLDMDALKMIMDYDWPGNIRELRNVIERAMNRCYAETMKKEHLYDSLLPKKQEISWPDFSEIGKLDEMKRELEKNIIETLIYGQNLSIVKAAERLGISRQMLHRKIKQYGI